ncbi:hypothetical protein GEOBRER4_n1656 [Citrifermentans bremense]|uniref:Uncharacterized protein n=1 Tax=Citrifermentans bremense TaxID=60035 RepID=A0A6S6LZ41_9BACT|nr:hypothetical protein [Citrifermentans bremense]BCG46843.1 hypothetical protein GEOBRER4_n1656 [Citrifermentans bremense]
MPFKEDGALFKKVGVPLKKGVYPKSPDGAPHTIFVAPSNIDGIAVTAMWYSLFSNWWSQF